MPAQRRAKQHEFAVARHEKIQHLLVACRHSSDARAEEAADRAPARHPKSSIDWFWQTRQRNSCDNARARASNAGSDSTSSGCTAKPGAVAIMIRHSTMAHRRFMLFCRLHPQGGRLRLRRLGRANTQSAIGQGQRAAKEHHHRTKPDQQHQRLVINPHRHRSVSAGIAEREIKLARTARQQRGFGGSRYCARQSCVWKVADVRCSSPPLRTTKEPTCSE